MAEERARREKFYEGLTENQKAEFINGECVVIDGGQWLRGAGEFNDLLMLPEAAWEAMEAARAKKS